MASLGQFLCFTVAVLVVAVLYAYARQKKDGRELTKKEWLGVAKGVALAFLFVLGAALLGSLFSGKAEAAEGGTYFNEASVYFGLDHTKKLSPMCEDSGPDSRTTSNMGLKLNLYRSQDRRFEVGSKYTHHSCAFSPDARSYDAFGFVAEYKFWTR